MCELLNTIFQTDTKILMYLVRLQAIGNANQGSVSQWVNTSSETFKSSQDSSRWYPHSLLFRMFILTTEMLLLAGRMFDAFLANKCLPKLCWWHGPVKTPLRILPNSLSTGVKSLQLSMISSKLHFIQYVLFLHINQELHTYDKLGLTARSVSWTPVRPVLVTYVLTVQKMLRILSGSLNKTCCLR